MPIEESKLANKYQKSENLNSESEENNVSFLKDELKQDDFNMISKSFEMSEIINNRDQSALLDHMKDISFLMSGHQDNNDKNSERLNIGAKPKII